MAEVEETEADVPEDICEVKRSHKTINIFSLEGNMAPTYKLSYFPISALAEPIRFLFSYGNIEFEDIRIEKEKWPQFKPNMPFGQMPVLEINGKMYHQSMAICRYVAKQVKLIGSDDLENLEIDAAVDTVNDFRAKIAMAHYEADEKIKETKFATVTKEVIPFYLERLEKMAKANKGHLACGKLTWADMVFAGLLDYMNIMAKCDLIAQYPSLQEVKKNVLAEAGIKKYLANRPKCEF